MADDTTADNIVANYRQFYQLYINFLDSTLNSGDTAAITTMANLCPLTNGDVVFKARALYDVVNNVLQLFPSGCADTIRIDSMLERHSAPGSASLTAGSPKGDTVANYGQQYVLFPNPNSGNFTLQQGVADQQPVIAEMWDVTGRNIYKDYLHFDALTTNLQVVNAVPGFYLLQLTDSKGRMFKFKFVVR